MIKTLTITLAVCLSMSTKNNIQSKSSISKFWKGPTIQDYLEKDGTKYLHSIFFMADSIGTSKRYSLPIIVHKNDTAYSVSDGFLSIESGNWKKNGDTLVFMVETTQAGPGGPKLGYKKRTLLVKGKTLIELGGDIHFSEVSEKEFVLCLSKWGM